MEEELNEHDLEERLYAMLHHVDETQNNVNQNSNQDETNQLFENGPRSSIRRYWRTSAESSPHVKINTPNPHVKVNALNPHVKTNTNNPYVKVNTPKPAPVTNNSISKPNNDNTKPKEEKGSPSSPESAVDLSIFQSPIPQNVKTIIQIIEHDDNHKVILESSDEDEVVEVALPPKPTITIESSDEEEVPVIKPDSASKTPKPAVTSNNTDRAISASPVPSVVSSVSDDFIRGDCIALNISSRQPDNPSFDFSLHGSDLPIQETPSKKKKKKKNKETATSTPIAADTSVNQPEECFATPKSKAKNKKKAKPNVAPQKIIPAPDFYDSDSNQSIIDITKGKNAYAVTEKSLPSADVYESDSSQSEAQVQVKNNTLQKVDLTSSNTLTKDNEPKTNNPATQNNKTNEVIVDLTENDTCIMVDDIDITESIVVANVTGLANATGFAESEDYDDENQTPFDANISKFVSSKVPSILNADLDFDNLKGKERVCNKRRYSMTSLRAEMEKFYNESWGGEDFNHREIQKNMSRDKNLWIIDPKDRMPSYGQRKVRCNYCNRPGHRDDMCIRKPAVCYMCGVTGHNETRCPSKICINCGAPNQVYTNMCRNCSTWASLECAECGQTGHPSSHCPDLWRRYHNTIDINMPLEKCFQSKRPVQQYCSGCSRRGHLLHACRTTVPFSSHHITTPYVCVYRPLYFQETRTSFTDYTQNTPNRPHKSFSQDSTVSSATTTPTHDRNKRQSKSPLHESHINKKRNLSTGDDKNNKVISRQTPTIKEVAAVEDKTDTAKEVEKAPDFIPINSSNHDNRGHVIQDNEVSDTSDVVTSARMYITEYIYDKLQTKEHQDWLKETTHKLNVTVQCCGGAYPFLSIRGKTADQESFQFSIREKKWEQDPDDQQPKSKPDTPSQDTPAEQQALENLPKNRYNLIRHLSRALDTLKLDFGNPKDIHKELRFLQNRHDKLIKQKVINPTVLSHSRTNINNTLKKLNTVLLGQAGLANGTDSVNQLYTLKEKLSTIRGNNISKALRCEIGEHFHCIFSPNAREDYSDLLKLYEQSLPKSKSGKGKKKRKKPLSSNPQIKSKTLNQDMIPPQANPQTPNTAGVGTQEQKHMRRLKFFQQRLMNSKPTGAAQKKAKIDLERKMYSCIASINKNIKMTSKQMKKVKKAQQEAQSFLSDQ